MSPSLVTSIARGRTLTEYSLASCSAVKVTRSRSLDAITRLAPSCAKRSAMPAPMPRQAPVMTTVLPLKRVEETVDMIGAPVKNALPANETAIDQQVDAGAERRRAAGQENRRADHFFDAGHAAH